MIAILTGIAALAAAVQPSAAQPADAKSVAAFVDGAMAAGVVTHIDQLRTMGRNADISQRITDQVLAGEKHATVARLEEFAELGRPLPKVGDVVLVTGYDGRPAFIYRVVATQTLPFAAIASWHIVGEGPGLRELDAWRNAHRGLWKLSNADLTPAEIDARAVVWQRFELIYPRPGGATGFGAQPVR